MTPSEAAMGYDLHVTRADSWLDSEQRPITLDEWIAFVRSDPSLRLDGFAEATSDEGESIRIEAPGIAVWTAYSQHGVDGNMAWLHWFGGRVDAKNPDEEIRRKLHAIAVALRAKVQGDEGEDYGLDGEPVAG